MTDMAKTLGMKPQAVSNQLVRLSDTRMLSSRRDGNNVYYRVETGASPPLLDLALCLMEDEGRNRRTRRPMMKSRSKSRPREVRGGRRQRPVQRHAGVRSVAEAFGYSPEELASIPAEANMGLSCGNPTATANLRPGEVVVDLGSGGGLDVFLAARKVGPDRQGHRHRHDAGDDRAGAGRTPTKQGSRTSSSTWPPSTSCRCRTPRSTA